MNFEKLELCKRSARLSAEIYKATANLQDFGFFDQITRAGLSIPSNISEGFERKGSKEIANFLNYVKGFAGELRTQIYIGAEIGYIVNEVGKKWIHKIKEISKMLYSLKLKIKQTTT